MTDPAALMAIASAGTAAIGLSAVAALKGWRGWLELKRIEAGRGRRGGSPGARPEVAELRARIRRLEAIASGSEI